MPTSIIEEALYKEQIEKLRIDWELLDDAFLTMEQAVLKVPDIFPLIPGTRLRRVQLVGFPGVPPISIYFVINGPNAHLVAAEPILSED
jgi:hypothetical protein